MRRTKFGSKLTLLASGVVALGLGLASVPATVDFEDWTVAKKNAEAGKVGGNGSTNGSTNGGGIGQAETQTSPQEAAKFIQALGSKAALLQSTARSEPPEKRAAVLRDPRRVFGSRTA